jgi:hypothetical protein
MRISRFTPLLLCVLFSVSAAPATADTIFLNEATFVSAAGPLTLESFEALAPSAIVASVDVDGFTIGTVTPALQVRNTPLAGSFATHGSTYVRWDSTTVGFVRFTFDTPVNRFGLTLTDAFDGAVGGTLTFTTSGGSIFTLSGNNGDGSRRFWGLIADNPFTVLTISSSFPDGIGMDGLLYGNAQVSPVPEPTSLLLLGMGAAGLLAKVKRWKQQ